MAHELTRPRITRVCEGSRNGRPTKPAPATIDEDEPDTASRRRRLARVVVVAAVCVGLAAAGKALLTAKRPKALAPGDGVVCLLVNENSGRCLSVEGGADKPGARIVQGPAPEQARAPERWILLKAEGGSFKLLNENSQRFLEIPGGNRNRGVQAMQWYEGPNLPHQAWTFEKAGTGYVLKARHSGLALSVGQSSTNEGAPVVQWDRGDGVADQHWALRPVTP
jgi:hypothetical protein